jgi:ABC-type sugar transport system substrate-binding protein
MCRCAWLPWKGKASIEEIALWLRGVPARAGGVTVVALALYGCDANSFMPPRPDELRGGAPATTAKDAALAPADVETAPAPARPIELVLGQHGPEEAEAWKTFARNHAGISTVKLKLSSLEGSDSKAKQGELVREAVARHPRVLIVEPADPADPKLAEAIHAAQGEGIPVVLMGRSLAGDQAAPASPGQTKPKSNSLAPDSTATNAAHDTATSATSQPVVVVAPPPFGPSAEEMVVSALRNAKDAQLSPEGGAIILINTVGDPFIAERTAAIARALKSAGIKRIDELRFATEFKDGEKLLKAQLAANPKTALVFTIDSIGASIVRTTCQSNFKFRSFVVAGYSGEDQIPDLARMAHTAAVADFTPKRLIQKAISTAVALIQGKDVPRRVELPITVQDQPGNATFLKAVIANPKGDATEK